MASIYDQDLDKCPANYTPLSPVSFLQRTASIYPDRISLIHGPKRFTWSETWDRCRQLASALSKRGFGVGDTIAVIGSNTPEMYECAFGPAMIGAVVNTLNVRLDAESLAFCLNHAEADILITDTEFSSTVRDALKRLGRDITVIDIVDDVAGQLGETLGEMDYETFIGSESPDFDWQLPQDEWQAISLNYTSGTTGDPKGVVYHHRGAYLNSLSNIVSLNMEPHATYLWTLPMFHCNGWCFAWTMAANAGTNICLRNINAATIYASIAEHRVTQLCGAPIIMNYIINATEQERQPFDHTVRMFTAAGPPPASTLQAMQQQGFEVTHLYGLTETYGPAALCAWHAEWDQLDLTAQTRLKGRQGVKYHVLEDITVMDPESMQRVPADGETMGEIMFRGNIVMKGYLKNPATTQAAMSGGWFHSGDLAVIEPDGYIKIRDRSKDIIISGGENISSIEVENALYAHPAVLAAAVVAKPDEKWGETPCAFIELKDSVQEVTEQEIITWCRDNLAHFKAPKHVIFGPLPKTSTGKIQKFKLREKAQDV